MARSFENTLVIAISSRALFDLDESHAVYTDQGIDAYCKYQIEHENEVLAPGVAFQMVKKFLALNNRVANSEDHQQVEIVLISRNSADTGLRIFNSMIGPLVEYYGTDVVNEIDATKSEAEVAIELASILAK